MPVVTPGTVLMECEPFIYAASLHSESKNICDTCLKTETKWNPSQLRRCSGCHVVWYCSKNCQIKSWKEFHKYECVGMKKLATQESESEAVFRFPNAHVRLLIRALVKLHDGKDYFDEIETSAGKVKRRFDDLLSHFVDLMAKDYEIMNSCMEMVRMAEFIMDQTSKIKIWLSVVDRLHILGRIRINSFGITDSDEHGSTLGTALYLAGSIFDHSCNPHAIQSFQGTKLVVRSIRDIPEGLPLDQVTVSYIYTLQPSKQRREKLSYYYFHCECEYCQTGQLDKEMRSIICYKKGCNAEIDIDELEKGIPCQACGQKLNKKSVKKILEAENFVIESKYDLEDTDPETFLFELKKLNFSDTNWAMIKMYGVAMVEASIQRNYEKAYQYGLKRLEGMRRYLNPNNPTLGWLLVTLVEWSLFLKRLDEAEQMMNQAKSILEICIGKDSPYFKSRIAYLEEQIQIDKIALMLVKSLLEK